MFKRTGSYSPPWSQIFLTHRTARKFAAVSDKHDYIPKPCEHCLMKKLKYETKKRKKIKKIVDK